MPIKAYQGSPNLIQPEPDYPLGRYKDDFIGSGEGAQAYGHGHYFAENPEVANTYRYVNSGIDPDETTYDGKPISHHYNEAMAAKDVADRRRISGPEMSRLNAKAGFWEKLMTNWHPDNAISEANTEDFGWPEYTKFANSLDRSKFNVPKAGHMYEVAINAHPDHFLDWDKPLSEQPLIVQDMARNADLSHLKPGNRTRRQIEMWRDGTLPNKESEPTGNVLHSALTDYGTDLAGQRALSKKMQDAGIPGIKYLDQSSRGKGEGTRNYVVFDPSHVDIKNRYAKGGITKAEGGEVEETVPEAPHTLESQLQAFLQGKRKAVLYTHEEPAPPEGAQRLETAHGVFHYNPALIDERSIKAAVAGDRINEILGYGPYSKKDVLNRVTAGDTPLAVVGRDAEGREVVAAAGTHGTANEQASAIAAQLPTGGQVHIESPANVLFERIAALRTPEQGNKDARKALMIARAMGGRIAKAGGGELPLVGPTPAMATDLPSLRSQVPLETVYQGEDNDPSRSWGDLATPPANQENVLKTQAVAPVYTSRVHELLTNPSALNRMKMGRPQQWVKSLQRGGAKPEEINMYGIGEGDPNTKISRGEIYSRIDGKIPQLREKLLGGGGNKSDLEVNYDDWVTEEPDDQWLYDNAVNRRQNDVRDNRHDINFMEPYAERAVDSYSEKHLSTFNRDSFFSPNHVEPEKIEGFVHHALEGELLSKDTAQGILDAAKNKAITSEQWSDAVEEMNKNQVAKIESERAKGSHSNGDLSDHTKHYEEAVHALHGVANAQISKHFEDEAMDDRAALEDLTQQEREGYYEDRDSPQTRTASVYNPNGRDLDYDVRHTGYDDGFYVSDHRGHHIGNADSNGEAEELIRNHASKLLGVSGAESGQKNIDKPNVHDVGVYGEGSQYSLPGVTDFREHTLHFDPPTGREFTEGHYDPNAVVHMRYGTVNDTNDKRLLYLDELQSDWHQKGMARGYDTPEGLAAQKTAQVRYAAAEKELEGHRSHIASRLGLSRINASVDDYAAMMLMTPETSGDVQHVVFRKYEYLNARDSDLARAMFGKNADDLTAPELIKNFQDYSKSAFGDNYKQHALALNSALEKQSNLQEAVRGNLLPNAPWKNTSEWSKLAMKRALRIAADYGYDGVALSPGWVQKERWGNKDHQKTYDDLMGGSMRSLAKQEGLNFGTASIPLLRTHARNKGINNVQFSRSGSGEETSRDVSDQAHTIYLEDEHKDKIRKQGFKLFKQGGYVPMKNSSAVEQALKLTSKSGATLPAAVFLARQHQSRN